MSAEKKVMGIDNSGVGYEPGRHDMVQTIIMADYPSGSSGHAAAEP